MLKAGLDEALLHELVGHCAAFDFVAADALLSACRKLTATQVKSFLRHLMNTRLPPALEGPVRILLCKHLPRFGLDPEKLVSFPRWQPPPLSDIELQARTTLEFLGKKACHIGPGEQISSAPNDGCYFGGVPLGYPKQAWPMYLGAPMRFFLGLDFRTAPINPLRDRYVGALNIFVACHKQIVYASNEPRVQVQSFPNEDSTLAKRRSMAIPADYEPKWLQSYAVQFSDVYQDRLPAASGYAMKILDYDYIDRLETASRKKRKLPRRPEGFCYNLENKVPSCLGPKFGGYPGGIQSDDPIDLTRETLLLQFDVAPTEWTGYAAAFSARNFSSYCKGLT